MDSQPARLPVRDGYALTEREVELIALLTSGHSVMEMAQLLCVSPRTVENHKRRVYVKLGVGNHGQAASLAASIGLIGSGGTPSDRPAPIPLPGSLVVLCGRSGRGLTGVTEALRRRGLPFLHICHSAQEGWPHPEGFTGGRPVVWSGRPDGTEVAVTVLVDPGPYEWLLAEDVAAPVVVCTTGTDLGDLVHALLRGTRAVVRVADVGEHLVPILSMACLGYVALPAGHLDELAEWLGLQVTARPGGVPDLTPRELDILGSIADGHTVRQTALALGIAVKTVENTQARLFRKLGVHNRAGALAMAHRLGLVNAEKRDE